ncbi:hypothetical protein VOLCADRAFT_91806 [Volvox carteri f. nagariensis]|uniref:Uncharacterized protein n=1 Tax=Volvox carteri f. nagariensis TaxID=3068 RepID=D8TY02_VOLCA|nr:uncharacterized protein VOLCADRAFT_91806 [Volvox carteri f. nagariensis]EFJ47561.1 hypothetical protein VOLCADRAFT_91806 [Volvox carteri f. nagariensis]|eukprot:XP_002951385.1 hypothetical protein VOLCADRAFT_91806 [Volvox carteri f. nagariensis]
MGVGILEVVVAVVKAEAMGRVRAEAVAMAMVEEAVAMAMVEEAVRVMIAVVGEQECVVTEAGAVRVGVKAVAEKPWGAERVVETGLAATAVLAAAGLAGP